MEKKTLHNSDVSGARQIETINKNILKMERTEIYKKTNDDWYSNYNTNEVKLKYIGKLSDGKFRVACWGNDDFGIDKDYETEIEAVAMFEKLKLKDVINHQDLYDLGFTNF